MRKFKSLKEIYQVLKRIEERSETDPVVLYNVILRRTRRKDLVDLLIAAGFVKKRAEQIAKKARKNHLIIDTTHLERAELVVSRIQEADDKLRISIVQA